MAKKKKEAKAEKVYMTGFKGFEPGMVCQGMQFEVGKVYEVEGEAEPCKNGIHFCEYPLDVLDHYPLLNGQCEPNEFATVEALAPVKTDDNRKFCTTKIRIGAKLDLAGLIKAAVDFSMDWIKKSKSGDSSKLAASGYSSKLAASGYSSQLAASGYSSQLAASGYSSQLAASGDSSQLAASGYSSKLAASGYSSKLAASGDSSKLAASGYSSQLAASGYSSQLAASGDSSQLAASGDSSKLAASGYSSKLAASGDSSKLAASGDFNSIEATGKESVIASVGINGKVKAALGCFIACAEWEKNAEKWHPVCFLSGKIDGEILKADTWYTVSGGKWVEMTE